MTQYSPDGRWYWDGSRWVATAPPNPAPTGLPTSPTTPWLAATSQPYRSARDRANRAVGMLIVMAVVAGFCGLAFGTVCALAAARPQDAVVAAGVVQWVEMVAVVLTVPTATAVIMWLYRCCQNLPALRAQELRYGQPGWAIAAWFIPALGTLILPALVVREAWQASDPATPFSTGAMRRGSIGPVLPWWLTYVCAAQLIAVATYDSLTPDEASVVTGVIGLLGSIFAVVAACLCMKVMLGLTARQDEKHRLLAGS